MKVNCPNCQSEALHNAVPLASETRIVCAQCGTVYDAVVSLDGEVTLFILPNTVSAPLSALPSQTPVESAVQPRTDEGDNILTIPPVARFKFPASVQAAAVLEDVFVTPQADAVAVVPQASGTASLSETVSLKDEPEFPVMLPEQDKSLAFAATATTAAHAMSASALTEESAPSTARASKVVAPEPDKYSMGVQLLRVSPLWLLAGGLAFVALIVLCNSFVKPAVQARNAAPTSAPLNQTVKRAPAAAATNVSQPASNNQTVNQSSNQSQNATASLAAQTAPTEKSKPADAQVVKPLTSDKPAADAKPSAEVKPTAESKPAAAVVAPAQASNQANGNFTVQIGSYNDSAEAQNRASSLKAAGFEGRVAAAEIPKRGTWYRVQVGRFASREEAARYGAQMRARGAVESAIVTELQK